MLVLSLCCVTAFASPAYTNGIAASVGDNLLEKGSITFNPSSLPQVDIQQFNATDDFGDITFLQEADSYVNLPDGAMDNESGYIDISPMSAAAVNVGCYVWIYGIEYYELVVRNGALEFSGNSYGYTVPKGTTAISTSGCRYQYFVPIVHIATYRTTSIYTELSGKNLDYTATISSPVDTYTIYDSTVGQYNEVKAFWIPEWFARGEKRRLDIYYRGYTSTGTLMPFTAWTWGAFGN